MLLWAEPNSIGEFVRSPFFKIYYPQQRIQSKLIVETQLTVNRVHGFWTKILITINLRQESFVRSREDLYGARWSKEVIASFPLRPKTIQYPPLSHDACIQRKEISRNRSRIRSSACRIFRFGRIVYTWRGYGNIKRRRTVIRDKSPLLPFLNELCEIQE